MGGGFDWSCGQFEALPAYLLRADVKEALHMPPEQGSVIEYEAVGPASRTLYPALIQAGIRVLIYNGDADTAVPYIGNEAWTSGMEDIGVVSTKKPWHPWFMSNASVPSGSATTYTVMGSKTGNEFAFVTIRVAGHEVPHYAPKEAFVMMQNFWQGNEW